MSDRFCATLYRSVNSTFGPLRKWISRKLQRGLEPTETEVNIQEWGLGVKAKASRPTARSGTMFDLCEWLIPKNQCASGWHININRWSQLEYRRLQIFNSYWTRLSKAMSCFVSGETEVRPWRLRLQEKRKGNRCLEFTSSIKTWD